MMPKWPERCQEVTWQRPWGLDGFPWIYRSAQGEQVLGDSLDRVVAFPRPPLFLFPFLSPKTAGLSSVSPLLWSMAFYSYVIAFPNSCRAKSHGLRRGGTPPSRHLCKPHGLLIPF